MPSLESLVRYHESNAEVAAKQMKDRDQAYKEAITGAGADAGYLPEPVKDQIRSEFASWRARVA